MLIGKNMRSKKAVLVLSVTFFLISALFTSTSAQIRRQSTVPHHSFYFSAGYNKAKFFKSTMHVEQPTLNNKYDLQKVEGDNKSTAKSIFPWQLNYRLGWYFNYDQSSGLELSYDPVYYNITQGQNVSMKGTYGGVPNINKTFAYNATDGHSYSLAGANLLLLNFVKRYTLFRPNSNKVGIDAIGKLGAGPLMPGCVSTFAKDSFQMPQFKLAGWNAGLEAAFRITIYRYAYFEIAGKYDFAMYNKVQIFKGTAKQNLHILEGIACIGFTLPSNRFNPLFHHERKVVTIIPFFMNKKLTDSLELEKSKEPQEDTKIEDVPEFQGVVDKKAQWQTKLEKAIEDSIAAQAMAENVAKQAYVDSISKTQPFDSTAIPETTPQVPDHEETKKERKARLKQEKKDKKKKGDAVDVPVIPPADVPPGEAPVPPAEAPVPPAEAPVPPAETPAPPAETPAPPAETPAPPAEKTEGLSKKELKAKKKQEEREVKEKQKAEQEAKDKLEQEKEAQLKKEREEQEAKEEAQKEQEKKEKQEKKEQEKREKEEKKAQEKKEKEEAKEKEKKEKEEQKEKEKKEKEEQKEEKKEGENKENQEGK